MKNNPWKRLSSEIDGALADVIEDSEEGEDEEENNTERDDDAPEDMLIDILEKTTSMKHPVIFQSINLCQKRDSINRYGEKKLKCMVESLDLSPEGTNKPALVSVST